MWLASARDIWMSICASRYGSSLGFKWFINHSSWLMIVQVYQVSSSVFCSIFSIFSRRNGISYGGKMEKRFHKNAIPWNVLIHFTSIIYQNARKCLARSPATECVYVCVCCAPLPKVFDHQPCILIEVETRTHSDWVFHFILNLLCCPGKRKKIKMKIQVH